MDVWMPAMSKENVFIWFEVLTEERTIRNGDEL